MARIALISNPRSRQNRRDPGLARRLLAQIGPAALLEPGSVEELERALAALVAAEGRPEVLAINGGDGSSHVVLTAWIRCFGEADLPYLSLLCGGTMNTVASGMGVKRPPTQVAAALADFLTASPAGTPPEPRTVARYLLRVDDPERPESPQYGFLFGNGLISNFLELYYEGSEPTPVKAAWLLARGVASVLAYGLSGGRIGSGGLGQRLMQPVSVAVASEGAEGAQVPVRAYLSVAAGTVDDIGLGFRPFYEAVRRPGTLHLLELGCTPVAFVQNLPRVWRAQPILAPGVASRVVTGFRLQAPEPMGYMVDGDFHRGGRELRVSVGPLIRVIRP